MLRKTINICSLNEILDSDLKNSILLINIDRGCLMPESLIAEVYNNNPFVRNKIIKNTNLSKFNYSNKLIPTRHNLSNFLNDAINKVHDMYYVSNKEYNEEEAKKSLLEYNLPLRKIININSLTDHENKKIIYIDSQIDESYLGNTIKKLKIYKLNLFN